MLPKGNGEEAKTLNEETDLDLTRSGEEAFQAEGNSKCKGPVLGRSLTSHKTRKRGI